MARQMCPISISYLAYAVVEHAHIGTIGEAMHAQSSNAAGPWEQSAAGLVLGGSSAKDPVVHPLQAGQASRTVVAVLEECNLVLTVGVTRSRAISYIGHGPP